MQISRDIGGDGGKSEILHERKAAFPSPPARFRNSEILRLEGKIFTGKIDAILFDFNSSLRHCILPDWIYFDSSNKQLRAANHQNRAKSHKNTDYLRYFQFFLKQQLTA